MTKAAGWIPGKQLRGLRGPNSGKIKSCMKCKIQFFCDILKHGQKEHAIQQSMHYRGDLLRSVPFFSV